ncbi:MAG: class I SAM-dependent methyltransferase [Deltaproteobacteria bacterium]|nr:class I SAM-dependent methyltransferase [Deltaproteobacteria bacterium]
MYVPLLDRLLYRHPFEGGSARRYARDERPAFGDLDDRLLDRLAMTGTERLLDLGCGPGTFSRCAAVRHPGLRVIAIDPSRDFTRHDEDAGCERLSTVRAAGEDLPLADGSIDVAICLSSIRHVRDRQRTFRELRRVVRGKLMIVELDPAATPERLHAHADHLRSAILRRAFGPLVLRTAPPAETIAALAIDAGFMQKALVADPVQPVYILELA